jgi:hypothetical protein
MRPFAQTLSLFEAKHTTVMTGAGSTHSPLSAIHPHPIEEQKAKLIQSGMQPPAERTPAGSH